MYQTTNNLCSKRPDILLNPLLPVVLFLSVTEVLASDHSIPDRHVIQRTAWEFPRRTLLKSDDSTEDSLGGDVAFILGISLGALGVVLTLLTAGICILYAKCHRTYVRKPAMFSENIELGRQLTKSVPDTEGRVSFMRSTFSRDDSLRGIEHLECDKIQLGANLGRGAFGRVYRGEYAGIPLAIKIFEHDGTVLCQGNEPLETYVSRNTDHPNVVKTLVNETRRCQSFHQSLTQNSTQLPMPSVNLTQSPSQIRTQTDPEINSASDVLSDDEFSYMARAMQTADSDDSYQTWVVMEYCDRGSLHQAIKDKLFFVNGESTRPNVRFMLLAAYDIASAMNYLHQERVVHGDLKSQNVLLKGSDHDERGFTCKVGDFGLSRVIINKTHIDTFTHGTVSHSAPELFRQGLLTPAADVYSFGILLWELFTGEKAYVGSQSNAIVLAVTCGVRPLLPLHCPPPLVQLINDCWKDDHTERPTFSIILGRLKICDDAKMSRSTNSTEDIADPSLSFQDQQSSDQERCQAVVVLW